MFGGSIVALVTPFANGKVAFDALRELVEFHIENGTNGIVPCGTTGESATLSYEEHMQVVEATVEAVGGRVPVIAGTGSNSTAEAIMLTQHAQKAGADAALLITPYYNKPTQRGLVEHYRTVAAETDIPLILYNVPSRTAVNLLPETVAELAQVDNIVGIKEASGDLRQVSKIVELCGEDFLVLSGDDFTTLPLLAVGGKGVISVVSNILPRETALMVQEFLNGNVEKARQIHYRLQPLCEALFLETNPIPVKTALALMGKISDELRLPLSRMSEINLSRLRSVLASYGLIED